MPEGPALLFLAAVLGAVCGFILALVLGSRGTLEGEAGERERERLRTERAALEARLRAQAEALRLLPELLRPMLAAGGRRATAPLVLKLVDELLRPEQSAIFLARPAERRLALALGQGLPPKMAPGLEIEHGQGRVGHVAETRRAMDARDFEGLSELLRRSLADGEIPGLRADVLAPIDDEAGLVGVLSVGGVRSGEGAEKALLEMIAEVAALALVQQARLRSVEQAASLDGLTGVANKRFLQRRLDEELERAAREGGALSLLILDIDHFRSYNQANGHREGDEALRRVGQLLRGSVREDDVAARYGGEEFAIIYAGTGKPDALRLAEGIRRAVESFPFAHRDRQPLGAVTVSGGVAAFPDDAREPVDLIRAADRALQEAKAAGRNRIRGASAG
jgi:diguanylate cyclase (GGDEF)-like protein